MRNYGLYFFLMLLGVSFWAVCFLIMRRVGPKSKAKKIIGNVVFGPTQRYFEKRKFQFSAREVVGLVLLLALMLAAPLITNMFNLS
jgi:4-amino-4-deoxy-L-arabinose transferase-like glycosyltransferase